MGSPHRHTLDCSSTRRKWLGKDISYGTWWPSLVADEGASTGDDCGSEIKHSFIFVVLSVFFLGYLRRSGYFVLFETVYWIFEIDNTFIATYLLAAQRAKDIVLYSKIVPSMVNCKANAVFRSMSVAVVWLSRCPQWELPGSAVGPLPDSLLR